jgi:hypothetical protein
MDAPAGATPVSLAERAETTRAHMHNLLHPTTKPFHGVVTLSLCLNGVSELFDNGDV